MISEDEREQVRRACDFLSLVSETTVLRQRGGEFWGCCPFHQEKTASFHLNPSTGLWYCFSCKRGGDLFDYVMERERLDFLDAIRYLADRSGIELHEQKTSERGPKRNRLAEALECARDYYHRMLMRGKGPGPDACRSYLASRGFGSDICKSWKLGFAPGRGALVQELRRLGFSPAEMIASDLALERSGQLSDRFYNRAMFPINDEQGHCIAFGGRILGEGQPKYLNSRETRLFQKSTKLFAFDRAKAAISLDKRAIVVEGYTDVIALHRAGFTHAVATLGTALSEQHIKLLSRFADTIVYMFDGDAAGQRAAESALQFIDKTQAAMLCVVLPDGLDPADFLSERGPEALSGQLASARPLIDFVFEKRLQGYNLSVPGQRVAAFHELLEILAPLKDSVVIDDYAARLADTLGLDLEHVRKKIRETAVHKQASAPAALPISRQPAAAGPSKLNEAELSLDDRIQLKAERELLALMLGWPTIMRSYESRLQEIHWVDARHFSIIKTLLDTDSSASSEQLLSVASQVVPDARKLIASAEQIAQLRSQTPEDIHSFAEFQLITAELSSARRQIRRLRLQMDAQSVDNPDALLKEASELQRRVILLEKKLSSGNYFGKNG